MRWEDLAVDDSLRQDAIEHASMSCPLPKEMIEKDFWVCSTLDFLFHGSPFRDSIIFKGGTSLSKAFDVIQRFSEDIGFDD